MSSVIQSRNEKEKKTAQLEERRKRERRRMKELGVNGAATPEEDEEQEDKVSNLPVRAQPTKATRSMSPAYGARENGNGGQGSGAAKDSFLNYFFGKEGGLPQAGPPLPSAASVGSRHVSHSTEPSFAQSIRRTEGRPNFMDRSPALPAFPSQMDDYQANSEYGDSLFVSINQPFMKIRIK